MSSERVGSARTAEERILADLWSEMLGLGQVDIFENYWDLGGQSLLAAQVVARANELFQSNLTLRDFLNAPTIAALAALVTRSGAGHASRGAERRK